MTHPIFSRRPPKPRRRAFSLLELLITVGIISVMTGLAVTAFRGGSNGDGTGGAANVASSVFGQARAQAIMRNTYAAVIIDSDTGTPHSTLYRRMMTLYLDTALSSTTAGVVNPAPAWVQGGGWITLPGNNYVDPLYSNPFGKLTPGLAYLSGTFAYYGFNATGQACLLPATISVQGGAGTVIASMPGSISNTSANPAGQLVVSPGQISGSKFLERDTHSRYGFYIFPLGRVAFFQDVAGDLSSPPLNAMQ